MNTYLGVSSLLAPSDIDADTVAVGEVLYMEGYLYDRPEAKEAFRYAAQIAHANDRLVSLTLSDSFCVDRHRDDFRALVTDEVDLLFGNEDELMSLYEVETMDEAVSAVRGDCALAVITVGAEGCLVVTPDDVLHAPAQPVDQVLDTTGAGDLFAAGFLYGYTRRRSLSGLRAIRRDRSCRSDLSRRSPAVGGVAYALAMSDFRSEARRWLAAEPDADMREELEALLAGGDDELAVRFDGRLQFGTAGLRAAVGAGPQRMNRLVVQQAAAGLVDYLLKAEPDAATRGVIIGYDARRKSDAFALDTARVCAARGMRAMIFPHVVPTPVLAWNIVGVGAAAGVVVTASHNPPADNGYKVFTADGAQIVSPVDAEIAACIDLVDPCDVALSEPDDPLIQWLDDSYRAGVPRGRARGAAASRARRRACCLLGDARCRRRHVGGRIRSVPACRRHSSLPSSNSPSGVPDGLVPQSRGAGSDGSAAGSGRGVRRGDRAVQRPRCRPSRRGDPDARRWLATAAGRRDRLAAGRSHPAAHDR